MDDASASVYWGHSRFVATSEARGRRKARRLDRNEVMAHIWEVAETGGLVPSCAWCGSVRIQGQWVAPPVGALSTIDARMALSHSICPVCAEANSPPVNRE